MANPKSKVLPKIVQVYLIVMIAYCVDVFFTSLRGDISVLGTNLFGYVGGLMCIGVVCVAKKKDIRAYGATLNPKKMFKSFYRGAFFALAPTAVVAGLFSLIYAAFGFEWAKVIFSTPNHNAAKELGTFKGILVYAFALIFSVFMKEFFFRGYVIRTARSVYQFFDANIIQILLCIPLPLAIHARNVIYNLYNEELRRPSLLISVAVFWIIHEAIGALKWGLLARAGRDIWTSFFDHYFYEFVAYSLFYSQTKVTNYAIMVKLLLVQILSLILVYFFYKKKRAESEQKKLQYELEKIERRNRREAEAEQHPEIREINEKNASSNESLLENYTRGGVQQRIDDFSDANLHRHRHAPTVPKDFKDEELMDLKDIKVDSFYVEYAKEVERRHHSERDAAAQKVQSSDSKE